MNVLGFRHHVSPPQGIGLADCDFYHSMLIPGVGEIIGLWDLRQTVDGYLGRIDFAGKRVLEIGPASGFLAIEMERRGADAVAVELPEGVGWDFVPFPESFLAPIRQIAGMPRLKNSFWFNHAANKSKAVSCWRRCSWIVSARRNDLRMREELPSILITELYYPEMTGAVANGFRRRRTGPGRPGGAFARISLPVISRHRLLRHESNVP